MPPLQKLGDTIGISLTAISSRTDLVNSASHVIRRTLEGKGSDGLAEALKYLQGKGRISSNYIHSDRFLEGLQVLLSEFEGDKPIDYERFKALKHVFLKGALDAEDENGDISYVFYLKKCRELSGMELEILRTAHRLSREHSERSGGYLYNNDPSSWFNLIAEQSSIKSSEVITELNKTLVDKSLLSGITAAGSVVMDRKYRLSDLGLKLCEYLNSNLDLPESMTD